MNNGMLNRQTWVIGTALILALWTAIYFFRGQMVQADSIGGGNTIISDEGVTYTNGHQDVSSNTGTAGSASMTVTPGSAPGPSSVPTSVPLQQY